MGNSSEFRELRDRVRAGSQDAAWELVALYTPMVVRSVRRHLPEAIRRVFDSHDFVQVAWATFFHHPSRVSQFETPEQFISFMASVAANKVKMEARKRCTRPTHSMQRERVDGLGINARIGADPTPSEVAIGREAWRRLMEGKTMKHRQVIQLRFQGYKMQEIADKLEMNVGSVRRVLRNVFREDMS